MLSSLVTVSNVENISIIGHNNPIVNCKSAVGIQFAFCHNCIIQGIVWNGCGNHIEPGLKLNYFSNITVQNCTFQHSKGQAIVLSEALGDMNINDSRFVNNTHYKGHGAAIHYSSNNTRDEFVFIINNCNFSYNKMKSLVYLENRLFKYNKIVFIDSTFYSNLGISVRAINHNIYLNGKVMFQNNIAKDGAGIYISDYSTVTFDENSDILFVQNSANNRGGAVFLKNHSICLFDQNSIATFTDNKATIGTVYSDASSNVTFKATCEVTFDNNSATKFGAVICSVDNSHVTFTGNAKVTFTSNMINHNGSIQLGGIVYTDNNCNISFKENSTTTFSNNIGGAISSRNHCYIYFQGNSITLFKNNSADYAGGTINIHSNDNVYGCIFFKGNSSTVFNNNTADNGGAIHCDDNYYDSDTRCISFGGNATTVFNNNIAVSGGAINCNDNYNHDTKCASFEGSSTTMFNNNIANSGGAIYSNAVFILG